MKNMDEVREALSAVYQGLKAGTIKPHEACEMNNACGKIINTVKLELEYYALIKETPKIKFLQITEEHADPADQALRPVEDTRRQQ